MARPRALKRWVPTVSMRQSKWGRHSCRPHSHRCVVLPEGRNLASDAFPFRCVRRHRFRVCHRRSHRHPAPPSNRSSQVRQVVKPSLLSQTSLHQAAPRSCFPFVAGCLKRLHRCPVRGPSFDASFGIQAWLARSMKEDLSVSVIDCLALGRGLLQFGLKKHMDSFFHVFPVWNFSVISGFWAVDPVEVPRRSDDLKLPLIGRFGKLTRPQLSTFRRIACGGRWKTQPLVAKL